MILRHKSYVLYHWRKFENLKSIEYWIHAFCLDILSRPPPTTALASNQQEFFAIQSSPKSGPSSHTLSNGVCTETFSFSLTGVRGVPVRDTPIETGELCRYPLKKSNVGENFGMSNIQPFQAFHTSHTPFVAPAPFGARSASLVRCDPSTNPGSERYSQPSGINKRIWWRMSQSS